MKQLLNSYSAVRKKSIVKGSTREVHVQYIQGWYEIMREHSYQIMTHFLKRKDLYNLPNLSELLNSSIFHEIPSQPLNQTNLLFIVLTSLVNSCPQELYPNFLAPIVQHVITVVYDILQVRWTKLQSQDADKSAKQEVLEDKFVRDLSRTFVAWLKELLLTEKKTGNAGDQDFEESPACRLLFSSPVFVTLITKAVSGALSWPDSLTMIRALFIAQKVFIPLGANGAIYIGEMLKSVVIAMTYQSSTTHHSLMVDFIRKVISTVPSAAAVLVGFVPLCTAQVAEHLTTKVAEEKDDRKQKQVVESFLSSFGITVVGLDVPKRSKILDLPEKAQSRAKQAAPSWHDETGNISIDRLWE